MFNEQVFGPCGGVSMYAFLIHYLVIQYTHIVITNLVSENASSLIVCAIAMIVTAGLTWIYIIVKTRLVVISS